MAADRESREPWERQPGESAAAFDHFVQYRDMRYPKVTRPVMRDGVATGDVTIEVTMDGTVAYVKRSLRKLAAERGLNFRTIARQSERGEWVKRCEAYDAYVDRMNREQQETAIKKMHKEHALLAQQMIRKATRRLLTIPEDDIGAAELVRMVDVAVKVERLSRGESTENQAVTHGGEVDVKSSPALDLSSLSNEELDRFEELLSKVAGNPDD